MTSDINKQGVDSDESIRQIAATVALLSIDAVQQANSGHPGLPLGAALFTSTLFARFLRFDPNNPRAEGRDRFILSAGHGSALLYSLLHVFGYEVSLEDLKNFRSLRSKNTPGHPEFGYTAGVEATTGPLGQGVANAVGVALSLKLKGSDSKVYALVSDGDLMEGISYEAASLAGHLGLNNLVYLYDDNKITLAGDTSVCFTEDVTKRFEAQGFLVLEANGHEVASVTEALSKCKTVDKPVLIRMKTVIGHGSSKADSCSSHGSPLGATEVTATKSFYGFPDKQFYVPDEVRSAVSEIVGQRSRLVAAEPNYVHESPDLLALESELKSKLGFGSFDSKATREISGVAIQVLARHAKVISACADLESSTKTPIKDGVEIQKGCLGVNLRAGVREHAMGAIANGLAYDGSFVPLVSTFLVFADYLRPTIRLAALSHLQVLFVFTHDSFHVGEDGPTHQPIEHLDSLRVMPNVRVYRPANSVEVAASYMRAMEVTDGPAVFAFTRQSLPDFATPSFEAVKKGGYVAFEAGNDSNKPLLTILTSGSEVHISLEVAKNLQDRANVRVVSVPCLEDFAGLPKRERDEILYGSYQGETVKEVVVEASTAALYGSKLGINPHIIGMTSYGASAPAQELASKFGFTAEAVQEKILALL